MCSRMVKYLFSPSVQGLYWLSTFVFLVVYSSSGGQEASEGPGPPPSVVVLNAPVSLHRTAAMHSIHMHTVQYMSHVIALGGL